MALIWITGASSGLGLATATALRNAGHRVVAGARSFSGKEGPNGSGYDLALDVSLEESVSRFASEAYRLFGAPQVLINAAGILCLGAVENYSDDEIKRVFDVIIGGTMRMIRATLPLMREKGEGRIVNFSSVNGVVPTPFQGVYTGAKHALEGISRCLMMETGAQGIQVMIVEPGDHRGGSDSYRPHAAKLDPCYQTGFENAVKTIKRDETGGLDPKRFGEKLARALNKKQLPRVLRIASPSQHMAVWLKTLLPTGLFLRMMSVYYGVSTRRRK